MSKLVPMLKLEIVAGVEGPCVVLNDYRIAGPKPWGGGEVIKTFYVERADLERCIKASRAEIELEQAKELP